MVDIEKIKPEIIERLTILEPDKIILFGSYAYGTPTEESDVDLFLVKDDLDGEELKYLSRNARKKLVDLTYKYGIGFDILTSTQSYLSTRDDYFYKVDILQNGKVLYE
jgi:predicted nucleotidyltransferase